jgi:hypothetical protein
VHIAGHRFLMQWSLLPLARPNVLVQGSWAHTGREWGFVFHALFVGVGEEVNAYINTRSPFSLFYQARGVYNQEKNPPPPQRR